MTLPQIYGLLYGFEDSHFGRRLHIHSAEYPEFKVRSIPLEIAAELRDADPTEALFHIEFFPTHGELWEANCWRNSITRRLKHAGTYANTAADTAELLHHQLQTHLLSWFRTSCGLPYKHARAMTEFLMSGVDNPGLLQLAALPPELSHELQTYRSQQSASESPERDAPQGD